MTFAPINKEQQHLPHLLRTADEQEDLIFVCVLPSSMSLSFTTTAPAAPLCCLCGASVESHLPRKNRCLRCLQSETDLCAALPKTVDLKFCKGCARYAVPGNSSGGYSNSGGGAIHNTLSYRSCEWESRELLALCLKALPSNKLTPVVDAGFVYTEPHSRRIKVRVTLESAEHQVGGRSRSRARNIR